jgi:hypothetical protein
LRPSQRSTPPPAHTDAPGAVAVLLAGCGGDETGTGGGQADKGRPQATPSAPAAPKGKLDGTWNVGNDGPIETLTITGSTVRTTGKLACPGTLSAADSAQPKIELNCTMDNPDRQRGTLRVKPDGTAFSIGWEGPPWGGMIDTLRRAG